MKESSDDEKSFGAPLDERFLSTSPLTLRNLSTETLRRTSRRSSDVIRETKLLDDEHRTRRETETIRETKSAQITKDEIGGVTNVNEYAIIGELGKGSFAEVKLCRRVPNMMSPDDKSGDERSPTQSPSISPTTSPGQSPSHKDGDLELFAIKIFSKSLLLRRRNFMRTGEGRMAVTTDMDKVQKEIAIMKKIVHPNLVHLFEVIDDVSQDALYLVMEYVPGGTIMDYDAEERRYMYRRSRSGTMREMTAARHICDVFAGLVYLHMHHICHRDLKPENVLLDANGRCKIADFGVAHYFEEESKRPTDDLGAIYRSQSRGLLKNTDGTWCFWAPEMCKAEPFSGYACDTWAAGVLLWVFIYGTLPFMEETPDDLFEAITTKDLEFPADKSLSPDLRDLLAQLLRKQPSERITLEDALDHDWMQLVDEAAEMEAKQSGADAKASDFAPGKSLRARAYSFRRVHVTEDDINGAIRSVNNFVLVSKLKRRLTQKLQEARASLSRTRSPSTTPEGSRAATPNAGSKPPTPQSRAATPQNRVLTPQSRAAGSSPTPLSRASPQPQPQPRHSPRPSASIDEAVVRENSADFGSAVATPRSRLDGTPGSRTLRKRRSCAVM